MKSNIGELGAIRRLQSTNSCHIADFYEKRKRQSIIASTKPHTIASIHVSFEQYITSLRITNFTITLCPKIDKAVYAVLWIKKCENKTVTSDDRKETIFSV